MTPQAIDITKGGNIADVLDLIGAVKSGQQPVNPIKYIVPEYFYNMAASIGWDMSKFEIAKGMPDHTIQKHE